MEWLNRHPKYKHLLWMCGVAAGAVLGAQLMALPVPAEANAGLGGVLVLVARAVWPIVYEFFKSEEPPEA